jgi:hypothetical protein
MPSGAQRIVSRDFSELGADEIATVIERARKLLSETPGAGRRDNSS